MGQSRLPSSEVQHGSMYLFNKDAITDHFHTSPEAADHLLSQTTEKRCAIYPFNKTAISNCFYPLPQTTHHLLALNIEQRVSFYPFNQEVIFDHWTFRQR
ncbi:hypothetical protein CDAR_382331 [Caerostris darwini]|uniref:Uncharacterized protein n=1 Tax=Caerostris darwini TaxID=1538125 RepID=A0AAV4VXJ6_9ARAC|nr:hypothetical protein CDAR_382331 [Caerostris darwini]